MVSPSYLSTMACILSLLSLFPTLSTSLPQPQGGGPPAVSPTVQNLTMSGSGCPIGAGGLVQQIRNGTPVFLFTEWNLALPNTADASNKNQHAKWCTEQIQLANGPVGMQLRIATVSVGGWANLETDTKLKVDVSTSLGSKVAGVSISPLPPSITSNKHHRPKPQPLPGQTLRMATSPSTFTPSRPTFGPHASTRKAQCLLLSSRPDSPSTGLHTPTGPHLLEQWEVPTRQT